MKRLKLTDTSNVIQLINDMWDKSGIVIFCPVEMDLVLGYYEKASMKEIRFVESIMDQCNFIDSRSFDSRRDYMIYANTLYSSFVYKAYESIID